MPGRFDCEHSFEILPTGGDAEMKFVQRKSFQGLLVPIFWKSLIGPTKQGLKDMNAALKQRAKMVFNDEN